MASAVGSASPRRRRRLLASKAEKAQDVVDGLTAAAGRRSGTNSAYRAAFSAQPRPISNSAVPMTVFSGVRISPGSTTQKVRLCGGGLLGGIFAESADILGLTGFGRCRLLMTTGVEHRRVLAHRSMFEVQTGTATHPASHADLTGELVMVVIC